MMCLKNSNACHGSTIADGRSSQKAKKMAETLVTKSKSKLLQILSNGPYELFTINNVLWNIGTSLFVLLGPDYYTKIGLSLTQAATLLSIAQSTTVCGSVVWDFWGITTASTDVCCICLQTLCWGCV